MPYSPSRGTQLRSPLKRKKYAQALIKQRKKEGAAGPKLDAQSVWGSSDRKQARGRMKLKTRQVAGEQSGVFPQRKRKKVK